MLKNLFPGHVGIFVSMLVALMLVGCAAPQKTGTPDSRRSSTAGVNTAALEAFRKGIRVNPMFDAYAQRFPAQWQRSTGRLWPKIKDSLAGRNLRRDKSALADLSRMMRTSDLMNDIAIAQRQAMANLSEDHATQINLLGIENMIFLRRKSAQSCAKLMLSDPTAFTELSEELRTKQQVLIGKIITAAPGKPATATDSKMIKRVFAQVDEQLKRKFPAYPGWDKLSVTSTDPVALSRSCDYAIAHSKIVADLPADERLAVVRFTRRAVSTGASIENWKTRVYRLAGTKSVHIVGPMHLTMLRDVGELIKNNPDLDSVLLDSPGGLIIAGQKLAALIRERQMKTQVSHICMSACTIALLAGKERVVGETALIGFHDSVVSGQSLAAVGASKDYYANLYGNLPEEFLGKVKSTPNSSMWIPTKSELLGAGVITALNRSRSSDTTTTQISQASKSSELLTAELKHNKFFWRNEKGRLAVLQDFGAPDRIIQSYIKDDHLASLRTYWAQMPDELTQRAAQITVDKIIAIKNSAPALCADIFVGAQLTPDQTARFSSQLQQESTQFNRDLIQNVGFLRASDSGLNKPSKEEYKSLFSVFRAQPRRDSNWFVQALKGERKPITDPGSCQILANLMKIVNAQSLDNRAMNFRLLQQITTSWKHRDRYGNPLPYSRSFADFLSVSE